MVATHVGVMTEGDEVIGDRKKGKKNKNREKKGWRCNVSRGKKKG